MRFHQNSITVQVFDSVRDKLQDHLFISCPSRSARHLQQMNADSGDIADVEKGTPDVCLSPGAAPTMESLPTRRFAVSSALDQCHIRETDWISSWRRAADCSLTIGLLLLSPLTHDFAPVALRRCRPAIDVGEERARE